MATATIDSPSLNVRTFTSVAEIQAEPGYIPDNPIDAANYQGLIGEYDFDERIPCCVREASGKLCGEAHGWGWVAMLIDQTVTVIGNTCASKKFGADTQISRDRKSLISRRNHVRKLGRLADLLHERVSIEASVAATMAALQTLETTLDALESELGAAAINRLANMARDGRGAVEVTGIVIRRYRDEDGDSREEHQNIPYRLGTLNGVEVFRANAVAGIYEHIRCVKAALAEASALAEPNARPKTLAVARLVATLSDRGRAERNLMHLQNAHRAFVANDYSLLCYLVSDRADRYRMAQLALGQLSLPNSKDRAKEFVAILDGRHRTALRVDQLRF
jgi:hypothetical protein